MFKTYETVTKSNNLQVLIVTKDMRITLSEVGGRTHSLVTAKNEEIMFSMSLSLLLRGVLVGDAIIYVSDKDIYHVPGEIFSHVYTECV